MKSRPTDPRRLRDLATLLPVLGLFLLMPPFITLFAARIDFAGVPLIVVYIFGVWLALVVGAAWLARRLSTPPVEGAVADERDPAP